ncbi:MAG: sulfatase-like hydrolase/transferase [Planctomycetaceae bacterium]|nr:sulfatase-like hydrolase/transferase [Planctomycetaceae bacterium]
MPRPIVCLTLCFFVWCGALRGEDRLPNIVILLADDLGYGELGCQGNPEIPTPHIDSIATNGVRFTQGYVTAPFCSASRAGLLTGKYQTRFGYEFNPIGAQNEEPEAGLPVSERTLADVLVDAGYVTCLIGKWHLGGTAKYNPIRRGFDEFFGFLHEGHYYSPPPYRGTTTWLRRKVLPGGGEGQWTSADGHTTYTTHMGNTEPDYDADNPIYRAGQPVTEQDYLTKAFTREAVDFIDRNADRPFLLYLAYNAVHSPMQATNADMRRFDHIADRQRRIFAGMLASLDDSVGAILTTLRDQELERDTIVFFLSDNGGPTAELTSSNFPLRAGKGTVYEGGIRVPFLMQWPETLDSGTVCETPVISLDIFATALTQAELPVAHDSTADGSDLVSLIQQPERPRERTFFWRTGQRRALRSGDWKLVCQRHQQGTPQWELYNLAEDIAEETDLAASQPNVLKTMVTRWESSNSEMRDPVWAPHR